MKKYSISETTNTIRIKIRNFDNFNQNSLRIIPIGRDSGIRAIVGTLQFKSIGSVVQVYIFDKSKWTKFKAIDWIKKHAQKFEIVSFRKEVK